MNIALVGVAAIIGIAVLFSENRRAIRPRTVGAAFALQAALAVFALYVPFGRTVLEAMANGVQNVVDYANDGIEFLFGGIVSGELGFIFAFNVLPVIVFVSALIAALYYLRIMQWIVVILGGGLRRVIGASQVESLCSAANVFVGMIEAPLVVRPYLATLTRAQLFTVMAVGLSSVSGAILIGYASLGIDLTYLLPAAFMAAPGGLLMAKLLVPDTPGEEKPETEALNIEAFDPEDRPANVIEAAADGAASGLKIAVGVGAMLLAFVALLSLLNGIFAAVGDLFGVEGMTLEYLLGQLFAPLMFLLGVPWSEAAVAGNLLGQKIILNEFIAFVKLADIKDTLSAHTQAVVTFALCGFANLSALAIVFGGLGGMVPDRKHEIARMGLKAVLAGTLSNLMSAALASVLLSL